MAKRRELGSIEDYRNLLRITARLRKQGFLKSFKTDLTKHDKAALRDSAGPYLWAIRESGTHLLTPEGACYGINHDKAWDQMRRLFGEKLKVYYASRSGLKPRAISTSAAAKIAGKWERECRQAGKRRDLWTGELKGTKSAKQYFWESHRRVADANHTFMELVRGGMTREELQALIKARPGLWKRFEHWVKRP